MKVLLINPNSSLIDNSWAYKKFFTPIPPLGLAYIASVMEKKGISVSIVDQFASKITDAELLGLIKTTDPDLIGFSALTPVMPDVKRLVPAIRGISKKSKIVLGNIHGTCFPEEVLKDGTADIVVRGEGEETIMELCSHLSRGEGLNGIPGISFKSDGQIIHNVDRGLIGDLDSLPLPAWHLFDLDDYTRHPLVGIKNARAFPILASRGCSYRCYYCSQDKVYSKSRYRKLDKVVDEIEYFHGNFNISFFGFCDAYFPFDEKSGLEFCSLMIKRGLHKKIKWVTETRVDKVTRRLLEAMKESGAHLIMYGIEVGNEEVLKSINKGTTLEQARIALKETRKAGILSQGLFMLGLPEDTEDSCRDTINFAKEINPDLVKFNVATPYPGSRFFEDFIKEKTVSRPETLTSWADWTVSSGDLFYIPKGIDSDTLRYLQRMAMLSFYIRPKIILKHLIKRTVGYKNIFYGGLWLVTLFYRGIIKKIWNSVFLRMGMAK